MIKMCIFLLRYPVEWWNLHAGHEHGQSVCNHGIRSGIVSAILLGQKFYACNCSIAWNICLKSLFSSITRNIIQKNKHSHHRLGFDTYHPSSYTISVIGVQKFKYTTFFWNAFHLLPTFYFQHHLQPPWKSRLGLWTFVRSENCSNWKYAKRWTGENNCNISRFYAIDC